MDSPPHGLVRGRERSEASSSGRSLDALASQGAHAQNAVSPASVSRHAPARVHLLAIVGYVVATVLLTWPSVLHLTDAIPGDGIDGSALLWNDWWVRYAIAHGQPVFLTDYIYWPSHISLLWHTHTFLQSLLSAALSSAVGLVPAHNVLNLATFVVSGYGAFLVARDEPRMEAFPAFASGLVFAFCPYKFAHFLGHVNLTATQYLPLFVWAVMRGARAEAPRKAATWALVAGLFWAASLYTEYTYAFFALLWLGVFLACTWPQRRSGGERDEKHLLRVIVVLAICGLIAVVPLARVALADTLRGEHPSLLNAGAEPFSADLLNYFDPPFLHPILRRFTRLPGVERTVTLGLVATALSILGARLQLRAKRPLWPVVLVVFVVLTLGKSLSIDGRDLGIPLPYRLLTMLPGFRTARAPGRFVVVAALAAGVLVAHALADIARRARERGRSGHVVTGLTLAAVAFEYLAAPFPQAHLATSRVFETLAREPGQGGLLEVPLGWRDAFHEEGAEDPMLFAAARLHERRRMGGMVARADPKHVQDFLQLPFVPRLLAAEHADSIVPVSPDDRRQGCSLLAQLDLSHVLVSRKWRPSFAHAFVRDALPVTVLDDDGDWVAYRFARERCTPDWIASPPRWATVGDPAIRLGPGFSDVESRVDDKGLVHRWAWASAHDDVTIRFGGRARAIRLWGRVPVELAGKVKLRMSIEGRVVDEIAPPDASSFGWEHELPASTQGEVLVTIDASATFTPPHDARALAYALQGAGWVPAP